MSSFFSADEVRKLRLRDAVSVPIAGIEKSILVVQMNANRQIEMATKREELLAATAGKTTDPKLQRDLFLWMLEAACTDADGNGFTKESAEQLFEVLRLEEITSLVGKISSSLVAVNPNPSKASPTAA